MVLESLLQTLRKPISKEGRKFLFLMIPVSLAVAFPLAIIADAHGRRHVDALYLSYGGNTNTSVSYFSKSEFIRQQPGYKKDNAVESFYRSVDKRTH